VLVISLVLTQRPVPRAVDLRLAREQVRI